MVIPPLQTIESQMCKICEDWGITYINVSVVDVNTIRDRLINENPRIIVASVEKISDPCVQCQLRDLKLNYIAVDEAQVFKLVN